MKRESGILLPVFSLPNGYGIGGFGGEAYNFIDFLAECGVKYWQILPLVETGEGNSPYMSVSSSSLNPLFISPEWLFKAGLIDKAELNDRKILFEKYIDYNIVERKQTEMLKKAFSRFDVSDEKFGVFSQKREYKDYALYNVLSEVFLTGDFTEWSEQYKKHDEFALKKFEKEHKEEINYYLFVQYIAFEQWRELKKYAGDKDVKIIGDIPFYVAYNSQDVWSDPKNFKLNEDLSLTDVAGVPPDYFSAEGQLWGNPVYDFIYQKSNGYKWWMDRIAFSLSQFDLLRIDHFRAFDRYYAIPFGEKSAKNGRWEESIGRELFEEIKKIYSSDRIIAEDLGTLDGGVYSLLEQTGFAGMKVISFAFDGSRDNPYLTKNIHYNSICYTGTHDNDTLLGLVRSLDGERKSNHIKMVESELTACGIEKPLLTDEDIAEAMLELALASEAKLSVIPMHDVLLLDGSYRINTPSTVGGNWAVRIDGGYFTEEVKNKIKNLNTAYNR